MATFGKKETVSRVRTISEEVLSTSSFWGLIRSEKVLNQKHIKDDLVIYLAKDANIHTVHILREGQSTKEIELN